MNDLKTDYFPYADIVDLSRPVSRIHSPMAPSQRAAQFNPFLL